ncbi:MAG: hypothetical protein OES13_06620 [Acidimicrobiia bacterium]|nr:hypothetical protein [Acidimicrobiia bacterium]
MRRIALSLAALAVVSAACGDTGTVVLDATVPADSVPAATAAPATTTPPTTTPPTTVAATTAPPAGIVPGEDAEVDEIVTAYQVAFDSSSSFDEKAQYIEDPSGLESTVEAYLQTGEGFGGIEVLATSVTISGDEATVGYDLLFGGNPTYPNLEGSAVRTPDGWKVPRVVFCGLMASARVPCS